MSLRIAAKPSALAVIIGVIELLLSELFKLTSESASAWFRRRKLHRSGRFRIRASPYLQRPDSYLSTALLVLLLALTIVLELSIESSTFPSSTRLPLSRNVLCFGPTRDTRYFDKNGPKTSELDDDRVATYIAQTNCQNSLLDLSVLGANALELAYPGCLPPFERRRVDIVLALQGSAVGFVGNSGAGDPFLDYGIERNGQIVAPDVGERLSGTSFWVLLLRAQGSSRSFWKFGDERASERIASNMAVPITFLRDSPLTFDHQSVVSINCTSNNRQCYDTVRPTALSAVPVVRSYVEDNLGMLASSLKNINSSLCIFDSRMEVEVSWIYLNLFIPEVERNGRNGPTIVRVNVKGEARCLSRLPRQSARMYVDSMETVALNETLNTIESATFDKMRNVLQKAAVISGMKTLPESGVPCQPKDVVNGSTIGVAELVVTAIYSALLLITAVFLLASTVVAYRTCPLRVDPLNALWPLQLLLDQTSESEAESHDPGESAVASESADAATLSNTRSSGVREAHNLWVEVADADGLPRLTVHAIPRGTHAAHGDGNSEGGAHVRRATSHSSQEVDV